MEDFGHHLVVFATQEERAIVGGYIGDDRQRLGIYHEHLVAGPVLHLHIVFGDELIFRGVRTHLEGLLIVERFGRHRFVYIIF